MDDNLRRSRGPALIVFRGKFQGMAATDPVSETLGKFFLVSPMAKILLKM